MTFKSAALKFRLRVLLLGFRGSAKFWTSVYREGGNSGGGSYGKLAEFKAGVINAFLQEKNVYSVIEFGCGDGNQLSLMAYSQYLGLDVAPGAIDLCSQRFQGDFTKSFLLFDAKHFKPGLALSADLTLSLDVIFHLVEFETYETHLKQLFATSNKWVIIYGHDSDTFFPEPYTYPRQFTKWIESNVPNWNLLRVIRNAFPVGSPGESSWSDFYVYEKK